MLSISTLLWTVGIIIMIPAMILNQPDSKHFYGGLVLSGIAIGVHIGGIIAGIYQYMT